jgi:hypothetical protein
MSRKLNVFLALAAGLFGGLLSRYYLTPATVFAQAHAPAQASAPTEIRAQSFVLVDFGGNVVGKFMVDRLQPPGLGHQPAIVLLDAEGHEIWRAGASIHPLGAR